MSGVPGPAGRWPLGTRAGGVLLGRSLPVRPARERIRAGTFVTSISTLVQAKNVRDREVLKCHRLFLVGRSADEGLVF